jgi:glycine cleavage system aminomethyltransferase T
MRDCSKSIRGSHPEARQLDKPVWSPIQGAEHLAVREGVGMFNLAALAIIEVAGPGALKFLNYVAANQVDRPVGKIVYTSMLNQNGGIVADVTIIRRATDRFWITTGGAVLPHDLAWLRRHAPADGSVTITDISSAYAAIGLWGPKARDVLQSVADEDVSNAAFPYYTSKNVTIGTAPALALRVSYAGDWAGSWHAPTEVRAGRCGIRCGPPGSRRHHRRRRGARIRCGASKRATGCGVPTYTPITLYEAGSAGRCGWKRAISCDALLRVKQAGIRRKLCCLTLDGRAPRWVRSRSWLVSRRLGMSPASTASIGKVHRLWLFADQPLRHTRHACGCGYFGERYAQPSAKSRCSDREMARLKA